jgi:hypothetical protein
VPGIVKAVEPEVMKIMRSLDELHRTRFRNRKTDKHKNPFFALMVAISSTRTVWVLAFFAFMLTVVAGLSGSLTLPRLWGLDYVGVAPEPTPPPAAEGITFRSFNGVNGVLGPELLGPAGLGDVGWFRDCISLQQIEPKPGTWDWSKTDVRARAAEARGGSYLPCLLGIGWATSIPGKEAPPRNPKDWEDFVETFVAHYSEPPFNVRYFEVWNEPTPPFWAGTDQQFVDGIYLPAATVIHRHHCFVVLGGWPLNKSLLELNQVLNYHNAWQSTDILNIHYRGVSDWQQLYNEWVKPGKCHGIWQSEVGFTSDPGLLPDVYLKTIYWALEAGWTNPDQYKLFWYSLVGAGADTPKDLLSQGPGGKFTPTLNGRHLTTMGDVLGAGSLSRFDSFQMQPSLPATLTSKAPTALGFRVGGSRTVIALLLNQQILQSNQALLFSIGATSAPKQTALVTASGQREEIKGAYSGGVLHLSVPLQGVRADCPTCWLTVAYVEVE